MSDRQKIESQMNRDEMLAMEVGEAKPGKPKRQVDTGDHFVEEERNDRIGNVVDRHDPIQLSDHFTYGRLIHFTWPAMAMSLFGSIYGMVDGYFVSNYAGSNALAAVNLVFPPIMILASIGFMLGGGGAALVGKVLGEKDPERANAYFSLVTYGTAVIGVITAIILVLLMPALGSMMGATGEVEEMFIVYGRILCATLPAFMLQFHFHTFLVVAEKPKIGLAFTVAGGVTNMILDFVLVGAFKWGLIGAALATDIAQVVGGIFPMIYFFSHNSSLLRLGKCYWSGFAIKRSFYNGISTFLSNAASSLVSLVTNWLLMTFAGAQGVAAYGVIMYASWVFTAIFFGYCNGCSPIIAYHYGAQNHGELRSMLRKSFVFELVVCIIAAVLNFLLAGPATRIFVGYDPELTAFTIHAFRIYSLSYIGTGFGFFSTIFFTALNNGLVAGTISFIRLIVLQVGLTVAMGFMFGAEGLWWAMVLAQTIGFIVACIFVWIYRDRYHYL